MPGDLTRTDTDDLALVLRLAALTEDRTRAEQAALDRLAAKVDRQRNEQSHWNPRLPRGAAATVPADRPICTYSTDHPKSCPCRGDGRAWMPVDGWSRLAVEVAG